MSLGRRSLGHKVPSLLHMVNRFPKSPCTKTTLRYDIEKMILRLVSRSTYSRLASSGGTYKGGSKPKLDISKAYNKNHKIHTQAWS